MYTFYFDLRHAIAHGDLPLFLLFFVYVWVLWLTKLTLARRYRPFRDALGVTAGLSTCVIAPVYNEPERLFRAALRSVRANGPTELIVVVDGADPRLVEIAQQYADHVIAIPKAGKRAAILAGAMAAGEHDVFLVLDSDTIWTDTLLGEILKPFADPRVGGVTPRQEILDPDGNLVRRLADWIEDLRYSLTAPAQSVFGQVGCLAGRTTAYRREAFLPAVERLANQSILGVSMVIGDDRVLTKEILKRRWRTVYQSTALVRTDSPNTWRLFWRQQLRWGRSSQRETLLSLRWLWRKPAAALIFFTDILTPFLVFTLVAVSVAGAVKHRSGYLPHMAVGWTLVLAVLGMLASLGLRQTPHLRRKPADLVWLPLFVLQLTFCMVPTRLVAFATMFHNSWGTRGAVPRDREAAVSAALRASVAPIIECPDPARTPATLEVSPNVAQS